MDVDTQRNPPPAGTPHDHAWRRVRAASNDEALMIGEYRCDLCDKTWAM